MENTNKNVTINDVAKAAGISAATVSRVINGTGRVQPEMIEKVNQVIEKLGYVPNINARFLKTGRSYQILHVVPDVLNPYYANMYRTIQAEADKSGYQAVLFDTNEQESKELEAIAFFERSPMEGMVFGSIGKSEAVREALLRLKRPVVLTSHFIQNKWDALYGVGGRGIYLMAKHLLELGHRHIAYAGGPRSSQVNQQRLRGFRQALDEAQVALDPRLIFEMDFTMDGGYRAGIYLTSIPERPTAICCANDMIAMGVMQAMAEKGLNVPEDVSITGEDDIDFARICRPPLTTINNNPTFAGREVAQMLIERIEGSFTGPARDRVLWDREMMLRNSTAPYAAEKSKEGKA